MESEKGTLLMNVYGAALSKFSAAHSNLPLIYAFMKEAAVGFGSTAKAALSEDTEGLRRQSKMQDSSLKITL